MGGHHRIPGRVTANRLFVDHPEYVAGTMTIGSGPFGPQIDVTGTGDIGRLGGQVERILTSQLEEYGIDLHDGLGERANEPIVAPDRTVQKAMRYTVDGNDHIWYGDMDGQLVPAHSRVKKGGDARMAAMLRLRDRTERLLAIERDPDAADTAVDQGIRDLDGEYDRFVASYGRLNFKENLRVFDPNNSDPSLNQLYSLEKIGPNGFEAKGDMLSKRVVTPVPPMPEHVDEPSTRWPSASTVWDMWISTSSDDCSTPGTTSKPLKNSAISSLWIRTPGCRCPRTNTCPATWEENSTTSTDCSGTWSTSPNGRA